MGNIYINRIMKFILAMLIGANAVQKGYPDHLGEMFPNKESMYGNDWDKYKHTRQLMVDCDIYESENWLGTGKCKYSWECRGARMSKAKDGAMVMMLVKRFTNE